MIWPFKRKSNADKVIAIMDAAITFAGEKWLYFNSHRYAPVLILSSC